MASSFCLQIGEKLKSLRLDSNDLGTAIIPFRHSWQDLDKVMHSVREGLFSKGHGMGEAENIGEY